MIVSTRGRYALRVMIDIAENSARGYIAMNEIAERQGISPKYMEKIMPLLVAADMVEGVHGKGGGYRLTRDPAAYVVGDILRLTEGDLVPVKCLSCSSEKCERTSECRTLPLWTELNRRINEYLDSVTLADLMKADTADEPV